jgi:mRNA-degrading endonuclease RelE of RelBE toxin-antitoxin system
MTYQIEFVSSAAKEFRTLEPSVKRRIASTFDTLTQNPRPVGARKLRGHHNFYRIRVVTIALCTRSMTG